MRALRLATCLLGLALPAGCGPTGAPQPDRQRQAVVGGTPTTGDPDVFMLDIEGNNLRTTRCSATLIAPRTLLTAAHCLDPTMLGATSLTIVATNAPTQAQVVPGVNTVGVLETRLHPDWNAVAGLGGDLGLALLERSQSVPPRPWSREPLEALGGEPVRVLGYGASAPDGGTGTKRTVDLTIRQFTAELISLGNFVDKGICHGDSGGPTLHTFGDGVERLIGVHSFTRTDDCLDGADTRVDAKAPFLLQWLSEKEDNCGADFVCAVGVCLPPDLDCVAVGGPCDTAYQCRGRKCVDDAQHARPYCSRACTTAGDCSSGMSCDLGRGVCQLVQLPPARPGEACIPAATYCGAGFVCNGPSTDQARCTRPCVQATECLAGQRCMAGFSGESLCVDPAITLPGGRVELPAAQGCASGVDLLPGLALLCLARRRQHPG